MVPSGNSYLTSMILAGRFFWIHVMGTELVTLIVSPMYNIYGAHRRWNRFCLCFPSAVVRSKTFVHS